MSDSDIMTKMIPFSVVQDDEEGIEREWAPAYIVGLIRNILALHNGEVKDITIEGIEHGICIHGQESNLSFRWSIKENGETYLKAWGLRPERTWYWLQEEKLTEQDGYTEGNT